MPEPDPPVAPALRLALTTTPARPGRALDAVPAPVDDAAPRVVVLRAEGEEVVLEATTRLTLRVGASALVLDVDGTITLHGVRVTVAADEAMDVVSGGTTAVRGTVVDIN